jgi:hypothetical protein
MSRNNAARTQQEVRPRHDAISATNIKAVPSDLAGQIVYIRARHQEVLGATSTQLASAMDAGDGLIAAKDNPARDGDFGEFCCKCGIGSQRLCQTYMQLARNRAVVEAQAQTSALFENTKRASHFGIDAALKHLRSLNKPGPRSGTARGGTTRGPNKAAAKGSVLQGEREIPDNVLIRESEILRRAVSLFKTAAPNSTDEFEALASLRKLASILAVVDLDEITLVKRYAKECRRAA